jgi:hypothetical protein
MEVYCRICLQASIDFVNVLQYRDGVQIREIIEKICSIYIDESEEDFQNICG